MKSCGTAGLSCRLASSSAPGSSDAVVEAFRRSSVSRESGPRRSIPRLDLVCGCPESFRRCLVVSNGPAGCLGFALIFTFTPIIRTSKQKNERGEPSFKLHYPVFEGGGYDANGRSLQGFPLRVTHRITLMGTVGCSLWVCCIQMAQNWV